MAKVITENFRVQNALEFYNTFNGDSYYVVGSSYNNPDGDVINAQNDKWNFLRRVIFGSKVTTNNLRFLFEKRLWETGTVYDEYDDDKDVSTLNMYVTVLEGTVNEGNYYVYKCIKNNNNQPSTVEPSNPIFEEGDDGFFFTSDGYLWKYMFSITPSEYTRYQTIRDLPYNINPTELNTIVKNSSNDGIYNIKIIENNVLAQNLFSEYIVGNSVIQNTVLGQNGFVSTIRIDPTKIARAEDNSYVGMYLIVNGQVYDIFESRRPAGYLDVIEVVTETNPNENNLVINCRILPKIKISKSNLGGSSNTNLLTPPPPDATAYGVLDENGRVIDTNIVNNGGGYTYATAEVVLPDALSSKAGSVSLRPIISPRGGHGSDPILELAMSNIGIVTNVVGTDDNNIPNQGTYTKLGLIRGPSFRSDVVDLDLLTGNIIVNQDSNVVVGVSTLFTEELEINDIIVIQGENYLVRQVQNDTRLVLDKKYSRQTYSGLVSKLIYPQTFDNRKTINISGNYLSFAIPGFIIEQVVNPTSIVNREVLTAVINRADYDGVNDITTLRVTDYTNDNNSDFIIGVGSPLVRIRRTYDSQALASFTINSMEDGAYVPLSGSLYHFADFDPITRQADTTEKIKFIFDF